MDEDGQVVHQGRYVHTADGLDRPDQHLRRHTPLAGIAIQRSEGLLVERLQAAGHTLYCVSPKISARARERYRMAPKKDDAFDAFVLADSLRHAYRHWRPLPVASPSRPSCEPSSEIANGSSGTSATWRTSCEPSSTPTTRPCCIRSPPSTATSAWRSCRTTPPLSRLAASVLSG
ncbi:transposase [Streptomyces sp. NPDC026665]|uniref:IS110 family transposase n=1 Tax=Streptomyces sp. NPDC026665 TaxID=3154798 RepID=UPI0033F2F536